MQIHIEVESSGVLQDHERTKNLIYSKLTELGEINITREMLSFKIVDNK
jgi:hypothetical protein